jgi:hypothetical protein
MERQGWAFIHTCKNTKRFKAQNERQGINAGVGEEKEKAQLAEVAELM